VIENALKYAPAPTPIQLRLSGTSQELILHVVDQGPGIPDDDKQRVFERFQRGCTVGNTTGSGIGLAVVQALMDCMGGRVTVADAPGGGTDVQLILRRSITTPPEA
jgi:K+-sensing histidine kinase KdpD